MAYDNELSGVLFKNNQGGIESRPWYKGKIQIEGVEYELAAWLRTSKKDGSKFLSLKATPPEQERREYTPHENNPDDEVPF